MESDQANPDTQIEVYLMILDYLLCIGIDTVLHGRSAKQQDQAESRDSNWVLNSVHYCTLPRDLLIKLQLLDFANVTLDSYMQLILYNQPESENSATTNGRLQRQPHPTPDLNNTSANAHLSNIIPKFMELCAMAKEKVSVTRWVDITAQFLKQAAAEEYHRHGNESPETFNECLSWEPNDHSQAFVWKQASAKYVDSLQSQRRALLNAHPETTSSEGSLRRLEGIVVDFLLDLMRTLDPPVLVQLERGQLGRLSRAETEQLKGQIGLR